MRSFILATLVGFAAATAAPAMAADQPAKANDNAETGKADRVICRKVEQIGSRLQAKRICATAAQWEQMRQEDRDGLDKVQNQRSFGNTGG